MLFYDIPIPPGRTFKGYVITESGKVFNLATRQYLRPVNNRVRIAGKLHPITHLVATLYCPNPHNATRIRKRNGSSNHYSNLKWIKPKPIYNKRSQYVFNNQVFESLTELAAALKISRMTAHRWMRADRITRLIAPVDLNGKRSDAGYSCEQSPSLSE